LLGLHDFSKCIARETVGRKQQDADLRKQDADLRKQEADMRKYTQFLEILENTNLREDRRNKLEAYCSKYEDTM
jgi:hypothetical protein